MQKTILIPIANRQQARNVLRTGFLEELTACSSIRTIFVVPDFKLAHYQKEFSGRRIYFEGVKVPTKEPISAVDSFFDRISRFYINSRTARFWRKRWLLKEKKAPVRFIFSLTLLYVFGTTSLLRFLTRNIDARFVKDERLGYLFEKYSPDIIFLPNIVTRLDQLILRHAMNRNVQTVGMVNAWDNITLAKNPFRLLPQKLVCYNDILKREATQYLDYFEKDIFVSGMPQFDVYVKEQRCTREDFCARLGITAQKRIILFASAGAFFNPTEWQVLEMLECALKKGELPQDLVIVFRKHPSQKTNVSKVRQSEYVVVDDSKTVFHGDYAFSEILDEDMKHLADSVCHADVLIATCSTTSIDASVFDTPIVNVGFDGWESFPLHKSVRRLYTKDHEHYQAIVKSGGIRIARSAEDLVYFINTYLENPPLDSDGRQRIVREQCYKMDGRAGERIATFLKGELSK